MKYQLKDLTFQLEESSDHAILILEKSGENLNGNITSELMSHQIQMYFYLFYFYSSSKLIINNLKELWILSPQDMLLLFMMMIKTYYLNFHL